MAARHQVRYGSPRITADLQALGCRGDHPAGGVPTVQVLLLQVAGDRTGSALDNAVAEVARPKRRRGTTKADRWPRGAADGHAAASAWV
ncbi:MAG TPA: hypothetical protein VFP81_11410 [Propionibacteriaceae bacterium]|nr:hypothetical protein [Propionibacteriaceae bacterium]